MKPTELNIGDVVQLSPEIKSNPMFAGCMMTVTEPKSWGAQGYVQSFGSDGKPGGQAYFRAHFEDMEFVGKSVWQIADHDQV